MKYALVNNIKTEATRGVKGFCPVCGSELIAKCGQVYINYWAHKGKRNCDKWWENETEWHRTWKGYFPIEWQEVVHFDNNGEKHITDVKTEEKWALEFQHSYIKPEERRSRNAFYSKIVWVVDGLRRERDKIQFHKVLNDSSIVKCGSINIYRINFPEESRLLKEWSNSSVLVFFDFQESKELKQLTLWLLLPKISNDRDYLIRFSGNDFIELHSNKGFDELAYDIIPKLRKYILRQERNKNPVSLVNPYRRRYQRRF